MIEPHHVLTRCFRPGAGVYAAAALGARFSAAQRGPAQPTAQTQLPAVQSPASEQSVALLQRNGGGGGRGPEKTYDVHADGSPPRLLVHVDNR